MNYQHGTKRAVAHILDQFIVYMGTSFLTSFINLNSSSSQNESTFIYVFAITLILYMTILEGQFGQSLGKKLFKIKVVQENGAKCTFKQAFIRNLLRIIDAIPSIYIVGILVIAFTPKRQRVGDLAAKTVVIQE